MSMLPPLPDSIEEFWTELRLPCGWNSRAKVVRPKGASVSAAGAEQKHPLIVLFHGGGFAVGTPNMVTRPARECAHEFGAVVVCPTYKLIEPGVAFPAPTKSGWDILAYLAEHAEREFGASLDGPGGGFIVGGLSAGASLSAVLAGIDAFGDGAELEPGSLAKQITGVFLNCPLLLTEEIVPPDYKPTWTSREDNKDSPNLGSKDVEHILKNLQPDRFSPWFSPFNATTSRKGKEPDWSQLPPIYVQVGDLDPLRDDGVVLAKFAEQRKAKTALYIIPRDGHAAWAALPWISDIYPLIGESTMNAMAWLLKGDI
ncbi:alpha/beta-hydrolase [Thozetella sp. PMI_491]|nr:alpha/beta-hydrolase [Thozetella sp. PMI_491]